MGTDAPLLGEPLPVELMNTIWADRAGGHDSLGDAAGALAWLAAIAPRTELLDPGLDRLSRAETTRVVASLRALRDALRRLAADATADERSAARSPVRHTGAAIRIVNAASAAAWTWPALEPAVDGRLARAYRTAGSPAAAIVAGLAGEGVDLLAGPARLRACPAPGCVLYFVQQHPRREWCSAGCGNRARVARHYERHGGRRAAADG